MREKLRLFRGRPRRLSGGVPTPSPAGCVAQRRPFRPTAWSKLRRHA